MPKGMVNNMGKATDVGITVYGIKISMEKRNNDGVTVTCLMRRTWNIVGELPESLHLC